MQNIETLEFTDRTVEVSELVAAARAAQAAPAPVMEAPISAPVVEAPAIEGSTAQDNVDNDVILDNAENNTIQGGDSNDQIRGNDGNNLVQGNDGDDVLYGNDGRDTIEGGDGNDRLIGDAGDDVLDGGRGHDTAFFNNSFDQFSFELVDGNLQVSGTSGTDTVLQNVENLEFTDRTVEVSELVAEARAAQAAPAPVVEAPVIEPIVEPAPEPMVETPVVEAPAVEPTPEPVEEVVPTPEEPAAEPQKVYSYDVIEPNGSDNAGDIQRVTTSFNEVTNEFNFKLTIADNPEGFTLAINDGPNPKGHGDELALFYFDNSGKNPVVSAYNYDGENNLNSFQNEPLVSSLNSDNPFNNIEVMTDEFGNTMFSFSMDATSIVEHSDSPDWTGVGFQDNIGVWLHPVDGLETTYDSNGYLESWDFDNQSFFDTANRDATFDHVTPESPDGQTFDAEGFNQYGFDADGFDANGFNISGFDVNGFDINGCDVNGFDVNGFNADGFDANGFDANGFNANGFNANGFNVDGVNADGFNANGLNANGEPNIQIVGEMPMITVEDAFNNGNGQEVIIDLSETIQGGDGVQYKLNFDESYSLDLNDDGFHGWQVKDFNPDTGKLTLQVFSERSENWHLDAAEVDDTFAATEFSRNEVKGGARGEAFTVFSFEAMDEFGNTVGSAFKLEVYDRSYASPIALDLTGDGEIGVTGEAMIQDKSDISYIGETVNFDIDADGVVDEIEWFSGDGDGILVDTSLIGPNGEIDGSALFGDLGGQFENGYVKLAQLDANADGNISGAETATLGVWIDNGDTILQAGELQTLEQAGIESVSAQASVDAEGRIQSTATTTDGTEIYTEDVWFAKGQSGPTGQ